jgi:UDP-N-acetylglucosamine acyltransferase
MALLYSELIHPTAVIDPEAMIAPDVQIGPYAIVEGPVQIGPGCVIEAHGCLNGPLVMGRNNFIGHGAVLGKGPQHRSYRGEPTGVQIGDNNIFRELVTVHRGTVQGNGVTTVGHRNMFMVGCHVGHDVQVGNGCTVVNNALLGGHVTLEDDCILSGHTAVHQKVRIGRLAMLGGTGGTTKDVPPFILQQGYNCVTGLNIVGIRRAGFSAETIHAMRQVFRILYREGRPLPAALEQIQTDFGDVSEVVEFVTFIRRSRTGINPARSQDREHFDIH